MTEFHLVTFAQNCSTEVCGVVAAQAFHWFANDATLAELSRVVAPGGALKTKAYSFKVLRFSSDD